MKKTLAAVAVLGAFAGSALAADVTIYGRVDTGLQVNDYETTVDGKVTAEGTDWAMKSGLSTTSRIGIKGSEQISDALTVGFILESKLLADSGKAFDGGFDRESVLWAKTDFGTVYAGKVGSMWSDGGATNFWAGNYVAFGTGAGGDMAAGAGFMVSQGRVANRLSYVSPEFAGFKAYAEYSFGADGEENTSGTDRPAALGLNYANGAFGAGMVVTYKNENSIKAGTAAGFGFKDDVADKMEADPDYKPTINDIEWKDKVGESVVEQEDEYTINVGTSYDFGVAKVMLAGQYYKNADAVGLLSEVGVEEREELEGYSVTFGADIPAWGGNWTVGLAYGDGEDKAAGANFEYEGYNAAAMYYYPLSKRTKVYAGVGYTKMEGTEDSVKTEYESTKAVMGMAHYF